MSSRIDFGHQVQTVGIGWSWNRLFGRRWVESREILVLSECFANGVSAKFRMRYWLVGNNLGMQKNKQRIKRC